MQQDGDGGTEESVVGLTNADQEDHLRDQKTEAKISEGRNGKEGV